MSRFSPSAFEPIRRTARGKYAHLPLSSEEFAQWKKIEMELER